MSASHVSKVDGEALRTTRQMKKRDVALTDRRREGEGTLKVTGLTLVSADRSAAKIHLLKRKI